MGSVKTLHIVGYKNSGKTTLMNHWIRFLTEKGYRVHAIKHHGHKAPLAMPDERKDSMTYVKSGAHASFVAGASFTQHIINEALTFQQLKALAIVQAPDLILVEGYKQEVGDKVVLSRSMEDWESLRHVKGIRLIVGTAESDLIPVITSRDDYAHLEAWILRYINSGTEEMKG